MEPRESSSLVRVEQRRYDLAQTPEELLELLRRDPKLRVLSPEQAKRANKPAPFVILGEAGFTVYKPWPSLVTSGEGVASRDLSLGPAVVGRLVPTARGSRLELTVERYAVLPSQRSELALAGLGLAALVIAPVVLTGAHPVALALSAAGLFGALASVFLHRRRERDEDIRELLALVERSFGPLELASAGESPGRRDQPEPEAY
jgi:hypothetical protein